MESSRGSGFDILLPTRMPQSPGVNSNAARKTEGSPRSSRNAFSLLLKSGSQGLKGQGYLSVPAHWICPGKRLPFGMYRKTGSGEIILVSDPNRIYVPPERDIAEKEEPQLILLRKDSRAEFIYYLDKNLDEILSNPVMSSAEKAELFYYLAYRRLRTAYRNPGRVSAAGMKQVVALMVEQILMDRETMKHVFALMKDNVCKTTEHPECAILHSLNVGILSTFFVKKVLDRLSREIIEEIAFGYFFHNIGMVRLPQHIMNHTGPLNEATWSLVRQHPAWGLEIVQGIQDTTNREMAHIIMDHHERLDGKGYPGALDDKGIHFFVKVCSIVDAFDALISKRSYRPAFPVVDALKQIKQKIPHEYDSSIFSKLILVFLDNNLI